MEKLKQLKIKRRQPRFQDTSRSVSRILPLKPSRLVLGICLVILIIFLWLIINTFSTQPIPNSITTPSNTNINITLPTNTFNNQTVPSPLASSQQIPIGQLSCSDCFFFPVSKDQGLKSNYEPLVIANNLPGGGSNTPETVRQLTLLIDAAKTAGSSPVITSAYRSYYTQQLTFNYWVQQEINAGYSNIQASERANSYSAMAGHSEHQLGTTVDISASGCQAFDTDCSANQKLWEFLKTNAHKYGFVISYPEDKQQLTGYKSEPWHIRYLGVDIATEIFQLDYLNPNNTTYPGRFLLERYLTTSL